MEIEKKIAHNELQFVNEFEDSIRALNDDDILSDVLKSGEFHKLHKAEEPLSQEDFRIIDTSDPMLPIQNMAKEKIDIDNELARINRELGAIDRSIQEMNALRIRIESRRNLLKLNQRSLEKKSRQLQHYLDSGKKSSFVKSLFKRKSAEDFRARQECAEARLYSCFIKYGDEKFLLDKHTVIGRDRDCTIILQDETVSRHHAVIERYNGAFWIIDTDSTNGVFLDGERIVKNTKVRLHSGSVIKLGDSFLSFSRM